MKKNYFKVAALAAMVSLFVVSCDADDTKNVDDQNQGQTGGGDDDDDAPYVALKTSELTGITFNASVDASAPSWATASWAAETDKYTAAEIATMLAEAQEMPAEAAAVELDGVYKLEKSVLVGKDQTLTIKPGTVIIANGDEIVYIMVCQGGKIEAEGTEANPIIMTASKQKHGAWGGLHLCGYAKTNTGKVGSSEIGDQPYSGDDDTDCSGVMKFIRIEYAGQKLDPETEANGFTFYGVGSGTIVENCCAYKGADDGFEWFGGKATCKNLVSIDNQDDSFDWTYGFRGTIAGAYAKHLSTDCDHLMEGDSNKNDGTLEPISHPVFSDVVLSGKDSDGDRAVRLRRGSRITLTNAVVAGKTNSFDIISEEGVEYFRATPSAFVNVKASGALVNTEL